MACHGCSGLGHCRHRDTNKIPSGEASDGKHTVTGVHSFVCHVPSFPKRDDFVVSSDIIVVFSLGTHCFLGCIFLFTVQLPFHFT